MLAALAMLVLWSGPASADPFTDTLTKLGVPIPAAPAVVPPDEGPAAVSDVEAPPAPSPLSQLPDVTDVLPVPVPMPAGDDTTPSDADDAPAPEDDTTGEGSGSPLDPTDLATQCQTALTEAGLPGGDTCAA